MPAADAALAAALAAMQPAAAPEPAQDDDLVAMLFERYDTNDNGALRRIEYGAWVHDTDGLAAGSPPTASRA